ncbi:MAG: hypothetical protein R2867_24815 [Caldilineaceae bacterium]
MAVPDFNAILQHGTTVVCPGSAQAQPRQKVTTILSGESLTELADAKLNDSFGRDFTTSFDDNHGITLPGRGRNMSV